MEMNIVGQLAVSVHCGTFPAVSFHQSLDHSLHSITYSLLTVTVMYQNPTNYIEIRDIVSTMVQLPARYRDDGGQN